MGCKTGPEILQIIITSATAGVTTVAHSLRAAPRLLRIDVWIDNIRIAESISDVTLWESQIIRNADGCCAAMGEDRESGAARFDHAHQPVSLRHKCVRSVCAMPAPNYLTIAGMEVMASRFLYAASILGTRLCEHYFFIKAVRQRLFKINRGIVLETSPTNLPPSAVGLGERLRHMIENNCRRIIKSTEKASPAIITDAALHGWGAFFIPDSGDVDFSGGKWERKPFLTMHAEARVVRLALPAFSATLPSTIDDCVDNTSLQGAARKGSSKCHAPWRASCKGNMSFLALAENRHPLLTCGLQNPPQTACHAVAVLHFRTCRGVNLANASGGVLWLSDNIYIYIYLIG
ncbi:hypothetical protein MOQ_007012 [Trypanosoma cruzi marinkellei]|uniref:Target of rapamycin (TOR) kinase 1 n=1 Tax=Trypanosoma cruzi marinkellei TaxID=85056 RepID=K2MQ60_TRYCR|nr:hypothetical protein MOQ_007012 [Trypanosoma cruzi marinkellei]